MDVTDKTKAKKKRTLDTEEQRSVEWNRMEWCGEEWRKWESSGCLVHSKGKWYFMCGGFGDESRCEISISWRGCMDWELRTASGARRHGF